MDVAIKICLVVYVSSLSAGFAQQRSQENTLHNLQPVTEQPKDSASHPVAGKLLFELTGGPTTCFFTRGYVEDQVMFHRYTLGLAASYPVSRLLDVEVKALWEAKGYMVEYFGVDYGLSSGLFYKQGVYLDYLTLALTADYYVDCDRRLYVGGGASLGWLVRQWNFTDEYDRDGNHVVSYDAEAFAFRSIEAGLVANVGYRRQVWRKIHANIQVLGNFGVTDVMKKFDPDPYPRPFSNANIALLIGIGFGR